MCDSVYLRIYDLGMFRGVVLGTALGNCNMILVVLIISIFSVDVNY